MLPTPLLSQGLPLPLPTHGSSCNSEEAARALPHAVPEPVLHPAPENGSELPAPIRASSENNELFTGTDQGLTSNASPGITGWVRDLEGRALVPILRDPMQGPISPGASCTSAENLSSDCSRPSHQKEPQEPLSLPPIPSGRQRGKSRPLGPLRTLKPQPCLSSDGWDPGPLPGDSQ